MVIRPSFWRCVHLHEDLRILTKMHTFLRRCVHHEDARIFVERRASLWRGAHLRASSRRYMHLQQDAVSCKICLSNPLKQTHDRLPGRHHVDTYEVYRGSLEAFVMEVLVMEVCVMQRSSWRCIFMGASSWRGVHLGDEACISTHLWEDVCIFRKMRFYAMFANSNNLRQRHGTLPGD